MADKGNKADIIDYATKILSRVIRSVMGEEESPLPAECGSLIVIQHDIRKEYWTPIKIQEITYIETSFNVMIRNLLKT